jgi:glycosyltransferase involved in cell wall biosynthesis
MADLPKRVALIYDRVNKWGGAERVLLAMHELFPDAPLYTAVYSQKNAQWAKVFPSVIPSFLQKLPFATSHHELLPWATPIAFESFNFDKYDAVISVTSADAKGIITKPNTFHLCYCLTPTRYLWSHYDFYQKQTPSIIKPVFDYLKKWDLVASQRPDAYIAISKTVQERIFRYYQRTSELVYPPVDSNFYDKPVPKPSLSDYFLYVGRFVAYKRAQLVIETFNDLQLPLALIGSGSMEKAMRNMAGSNITFLGQRTDLELAGYYQNAKALIYFHEEDFGIVPVEAMAAGIPVIGLNRGGLSETVIHGSTGILIDDDSQQALKDAILRFDPSAYKTTIIQKHAQTFAKDRFKEEFKESFLKEWTKYKNIHSS